MKLRTIAVLGSAATVAAGLALGTGSALAAGPPPAATAFASAIITQADGGEVSGFGITATFAPGAVASDRLIILGNWPNGLDVTPPSGTAVKTFGLQECNTDGTDCTSELGNFPNSTAGTEMVNGQSIDYTGFQSMPDTTTGNTNFGTATNKLVTITAQTGADQVYVYNANNATTATAYPLVNLHPTSDGSTLTFQTFQPIVWVETAPTS